jgi:hypothetical protein
MVKRPIHLGRNVSGREPGAKALIGLFRRRPCETEELVPVRPLVSTKAFLNVCGDRFRSAAKLDSVRQPTTLEQLIDVVHHHPRSAEYP